MISKSLRKAISKVAATPKKQRVAMVPKTKVFASTKSLQNSRVDKPYLQALIDPFHAGAMGAQVPDEYPFPTATYHMHNTVAVNCPAASSVFQGVILPTPTLTYIDASGAAATNGFFSGSPVTLGSGGAAGLGAMSTDTVLNNLGTAGRVVGFGIRVKNNMNFSTVTGRVIVAPVIIPCTVFNNLDQQNITASLATSLPTGNSLVASIFQILTGSPAISTSLLNLPGAFEFAMDELIDKEFLFTSRPTGPHGKDFRKLNTRILGQGTGAGALNAFEMTDVVNVTTGLVTTDAAPSQMADCGGMIAFAIYVEGVPAGTIPLLIETICHLEFEPRVLTGTPTPSNNHHNNTSLAWFETMRAVADSPMGKLVLPATMGQALSLMGSFARRTG